MIKDIVEKTGYLDELEEERIQAILELSSSAENIASRDFIDRVSLSSASDEAPPAHAVTLMPLHNTKGIEFPWSLSSVSKKALFLISRLSTMLPKCRRRDAFSMSG